MYNRCFTFCDASEFVRQKNEPTRVIVNIVIRRQCCHIKLPPFVDSSLRISINCAHIRSTFTRCLWTHLFTYDDRNSKCTRLWQMQIYYPRHILMQSTYFRTSIINEIIHNWVHIIWNSSAKVKFRGCMCWSGRHRWYTMCRAVTTTMVRHVCHREIANSRALYCGCFFRVLWWCAGESIKFMDLRSMPVRVRRFCVFFVQLWKRLYFVFVFLSFWSVECVI